MKDYELTLKTMGSKKDIELKAKLETRDFTIRQLAKFLEDLKVINKQIKTAFKNGDKVEFEIISSDYEYKPSLQQLNFDRWIFEGYLEDETGIYLNPDTRYTDECRDIWYEFTLESLDSIE